VDLRTKLLDAINVLGMAERNAVAMIAERAQLQQVAGGWRPKTAA
jgi:hypothetical protein